MRDPYSVLGVSKKASASDIKSAFRSLAKKWHPDLHSDDARAEARFKEINAAYNILSDEGKRKKFDRGDIDSDGRETARGRASNAGFGGGFNRNSGFGHDFADELRKAAEARARNAHARSARYNAEDDLFDDLFGQKDVRGGSARMRGEDLRLMAQIDLETVATGGRIRVSHPDGRTLDVNVPPGIEEGAHLRLKGQGKSGLGSAGSGDAIVEIHINAHPYFERRGKDIYLDLPITLEEGVFGGAIRVPTVDGKVSLTIPKEANTGTTLRLKGKGMQDAKGGVRGDQYVVLRITLPEKADAELREFIKRWSRKHRYAVRQNMGVDE